FGAFPRGLRCFYDRFFQGACMPGMSLSARTKSNRQALVEQLERRTLLATVGGVDPYNMGKGDWIWQISSAETNTGATSVQGLVNYLKAKGLKWIVVKAGDGDSGPVTGAWTQFNSDLVTRVHNAGMKIFGYQFVYGGVTPNAKNQT